MASSGPLFVVVEREVCLVHLYERRGFARRSFSARSNLQTFAFLLGQHEVLPFVIDFVTIGFWA